MRKGEIEMLRLASIGAVAVVLAGYMYAINAFL